MKGNQPLKCLAHWRNGESMICDCLFFTFLYWLRSCEHFYPNEKFSKTCRKYKTLKGSSIKLNSCSFPLLLSNENL